MCLGISLFDRFRFLPLVLPVQCILHVFFILDILCWVVRLDGILCGSMALLFLVEATFCRGIFDVNIFFRIGDIYPGSSFVVSLSYSTKQCAFYVGEAGGVVKFYQLFFSFAKICVVCK